MSTGTKYQSHNGLNIRVEGPTRGVLHSIQITNGPQTVLALMGKTRNRLTVTVGRHTNWAPQQRTQFRDTKEVWHDAAALSLCI
ncbi:hypothetical protein DGG96_13290 [Legionella qingyii]|uniref:Uncharacterized protein n=1 Tax=Legionella qingyii TaxID=2184757 RepID=A0A317U464_9GAMM|nr:hypothetical protein DGG96_13290 [Legionella qingyii]